MAINKEQYVNLLLIELEKGSDRVEILSKYVKLWQCTPRTFDRYWQVAKERHYKTQQEAQRQLTERTINAALDRQESAIISKQRRMEIASQIANGEVTKKDKDGNEVPVEVSNNDRMKALDYLSRVDGDYAPVKKEIQLDTTVDFIINIE